MTVGPRGTVRLVIPAVAVPSLTSAPSLPVIEDEPTARDTPVDAAPLIDELVAPVPAESSTEPAPERAAKPITGVHSVEGMVPANDATFDPRRTLNFDDEAHMLFDGERIGEVTIDSFLAAGGICEIFNARNDVLGAPCVVKVLRRRYAGRVDVRERLEVEARALFQLRGCAGVVQIFTAGRDPRVGPYIVMERLTGRTLLKLITDKGALSLEQALSIAIMLADALHTLHTIDIVHRDLKPENIFIVDDPSAPGAFRVAILDLGCAKTPYSKRTTTETSTMGTARYMSPEHARKQKITPASDQYILGWILLEMLLGAHPFDEALANTPEADAFSEMLWHALVDPEPPPESICPRGLWLIIERMIRKAPDDRFALTSDVATALRDVLREIASLDPEVRRQREQLRVKELTASKPPTALAAVQLQGTPQAPALVQTLQRVVVPTPLRHLPLTTNAAVTSLLVEGLRGERRRFALADGATLGRDRARVDIWLDDPNVSRLHAELRPSPHPTQRHLYDIVDKGSRNGFEINGEPARVGVVGPYSVLTLGDVKLVLLPPGGFDEVGRFLDEAAHRRRIEQAIQAQGKAYDTARRSSSRSVVLPVLVALFVLALAALLWAKFVGHWI